MTDAKTLILIAGMHRSGTSVLTQVLHLLGAELGDELLPPQPGVNEKGFWEHRKLVAINEQLLQTLERSWYDFRPLPAHWQRRPQVLDLGRQAVNFLQRELGNAPLAAIKDPRLCLLLPFWTSAAEEAGFSPRVILATRAPWEVAASLCRRDPLDTTTATLLWLRYTREAETHSRQLPRACVDYDQLLRDWPQVVARIGPRLGVQWPHSPDDARTAIEQAIDPSLKHQRSRFSEKDIGLASLAAQAHHQLASGAADLKSLDELWAHLDELIGGCEIMASALADATQRLFSLSNEQQKLGRDHGRALKMICERERELDERTKEWEQLGKELEYCRSIVDERDEQLASANRAFHELEDKYRTLDSEHRRTMRKQQKTLAHPLVRMAIR
ncbi:MAG TPA: hypothetical protein EYP90_07205, partial [Chromatiaceae bacterium]|nr:hypothetical protein [Chromatiaceae bacterium]